MTAYEEVKQLPASALGLLPMRGKLRKIAASRHGIKKICKYAWIVECTEVFRSLEFWDGVIEFSYIRSKPSAKMYVFNVSILQSVASSCI